MLKTENIIKFINEIERYKDEISQVLNKIYINSDFDYQVDVIYDINDIGENNHLQCDVYRSKKNTIPEEERVFVVNELFEGLQKLFMEIPMEVFDMTDEELKTYDASKIYVEVED